MDLDEAIRYLTVAEPLTKLAGDQIVEMLKELKHLRKDEYGKEAARNFIFKKYKEAVEENQRLKLDLVNARRRLSRYEEKKIC